VPFHLVGSLIAYLAPSISPVQAEPQLLKLTLVSVDRTVFSRPESGVVESAHPAISRAVEARSAPAAILECGGKIMCVSFRIRVATP
jgi:hypothetical protein